ncbi:hypothetical protein K449DRAFT_435092 [Hypoxylon sp. EC38]|nr:hypothetical protein K449DRAFT_435092 [Hypoxylon sp. EC38]
MDSRSNSYYYNPTKGQRAQLTFPPTVPIQGDGRMSADASASVLSSGFLQLPNTSRPSMEQMMSTNTGNFQGWIQSIEDFHEANKQYMKIHNRPQGNFSDFPWDSNGQLQLVKRLFEAALDCSQIYEPESSQSAKRIQQGGYSDVEFELILWPLLMSTRDAQAGQCRLPNYLSCDTPTYNAYDSFMERFNAVHYALKTSKDIVCSLFKDATFKHRLAWKPDAELNQKAINRKVNGNRDVQHTIGARIAREKGIKVNKNGELVDRNGQTHGMVKKRSTTFEEKISKSKIPGRVSKRTKSNSKAAARVDTEEVTDASIIPQGLNANHQDVVDSRSQPTPNRTGHTESLVQGYQPLPIGYPPNYIGGTSNPTPLGATGTYQAQNSSQFTGSYIMRPSNNGYLSYQTPAGNNSNAMAALNSNYATPQMLRVTCSVIIWFLRSYSADRHHDIVPGIDEIDYDNLEFGTTGNDWDFDAQ